MIEPTHQRGRASGPLGGGRPFLGRPRPLLALALLTAFRAGAAQLGYDAGQLRAREVLRWTDTLDLQPREGPWLRLRNLGHSLFPLALGPDDVVATGEPAWCLEVGSESIVAAGKPTILRLPPSSSLPLADPLVLREEMAALAGLQRQGWQVSARIRLPWRVWQSGTRTGGPYSLPRDLRELHGRMRQLAREYAGLTDVWEFDNEPDIGYVQDNPEAYAAALKAAYLGLHDGASEAWRTALQRSRWRAHVKAPKGRTGAAVAPRQALVAMGALAFPPGPYAQSLMDNGAWSYTDALNFHYYGYAADFPDVVQRFSDLLAPPGPARRVPALVTEYGYGRLLAQEGHHGRGEARRRAWWQAMLRHLDAGRIDAAMAFSLPPTAGGIPRRAFGLTFSREGQTVETPTLDDIRRSGAARRQRLGRSFSLSPEPPSRVVVDWVNGAGLAASKAGAANLVRFDAFALSPAHGEWRVYNFAASPVRGDLCWFDAHGRRIMAMPLALAGGEAVRVPVGVFCSTGATQRQGVSVEFWVNGRSRSRWSGAFGPVEEAGFGQRIAFASPPGDGSPARWQIDEDADLRPSADGWWCSPRVEVARDQAGWVFTVRAPRVGEAAAAVAERALPTEAAARWSAADRLQYSIASDGSGRMALVIRTDTGALFTPPDHRQSERRARRVDAAVGRFGMDFFGRARGSLQLADHRPVGVQVRFETAEPVMRFRLQGLSLLRRNSPEAGSCRDEADLRQPDRAEPSSTLRQ